MIHRNLSHRPPLAYRLVPTYVLVSRHRAALRPMVIIVRVLIQIARVIHRRRGLIGLIGHWGVKVLAGHSKHLYQCCRRPFGGCEVSAVTNGTTPRLPVDSRG